MSIIVNNVSKLYGANSALQNVSFEAKPGEILGFIGPNGAGKTTMMKIITGYLPPSTGTVMVNGVNVMDDSIAWRRNIGYLPENNPLYLNMYVKEYLLFVAGLYDLGIKTESRTLEMIEITGLQKERKKRIGELSKGYRQRVGLAQALIHDPAVLILDEPTTGLDPNQIIEIRNLIKQTGIQKTVMLSTHIMQEVEAICDKIIILNKGTIVADGTTQNVISQSNKKQTIMIEFNQGIDKSLLEKINGVTQVVLHNAQWLIETESEVDIRSDLFNFAVQQNLTVLSLQKKENKLEDVFRELTN